MLTGVLVEWAIFCSMIGALASPDPNTGFHEDFNDLDAWQPVTFSRIAKHTTYEIREEYTDSVLVAKSKRSASGIATKKTFDLMEYPIIRWRWKISNIYENGDMRRKSGDDYPMRICIVFAYDPNRTSAGTRLKYELVKTVQGEYGDIRLGDILSPECLHSPLFSRKRLCRNRLSRAMNATFTIYRSGIRTGCTGTTCPLLSGIAF